MWHVGLNIKKQDAVPANSHEAHVLAGAHIVDKKSSVVRLPRVHRRHKLKATSSSLWTEPIHFCAGDIVHLKILSSLWFLVAVSTSLPSCLCVTSSVIASRTVLPVSGCTLTFTSWSMKSMKESYSLCSTKVATEHVPPVLGVGCLCVCLHSGLGGGLGFRVNSAAHALRTGCC